MDQLKTDLNGGFPLELDDLRWAFTGITKAFKGIVDGFGTDPYILSGCEIVDVGGGNSDITAGYVVFNGEVYEFPGASGISNVDIPNEYLNPLNSFDATGLETFEDTTSQNAYEKRRARVLLAAPTPSAPFVMVRDGERLSSRIEALLSQLTRNFRKVGNVGEPAFQNGWASASSPFTRLSFRQELFKMVRLRGIAIGTAASGDVVFTLPAGMRPLTTVHCHLTSAINNTITAECFILDTGEVQLVVSGAYSAAHQFDLHNVPTFEGW